MDAQCSTDFFEPKLGKHSILEATKQGFVLRNDSSIKIYQKVKIDNNRPRRLFWLISQIEAQCNMVGFVVDGHIYVYIYIYKMMYPSSQIKYSYCHALIMP